MSKAAVDRRSRISVDDRPERSLSSTSKILAQIRNDFDDSVDVSVCRYDLFGNGNENQLREQEIAPEESKHEKEATGFWEACDNHERETGSDNGFDRDHHEHTGESGGAGDASFEAGARAEALPYVSIGHRVIHTEAEGTGYLRGHALGAPLEPPIETPQACNG